MKSHLIALLFIFVVTQSVFAQLSSQDSSDLWNAFYILSESWDEDAKEVANTILIGSKGSDYTSEEYQSFFNAYYEANLISEGLSSYIGYPTFYWGGSKHESLQTAQVIPLLSIVDSKLRMDDFSNKISSDETFRNKFFKTTSHLYSICYRKESLIEDSYKEQFVSQMEQLCVDFPEVYERTYAHNPDEKPYLEVLDGKCVAFCLQEKS